jgi:hypothetical protein
MERSRRESLADTLIAWGFVLSFVGLMAAACFEAYKIVAVIPAAFNSSPVVWRNPMAPWTEDSPPTQSGRRRMSPQRGGQEAP